MTKEQFIELIKDFETATIEKNKPEASRLCAELIDAWQQRKATP